MCLVFFVYACAVPMLLRMSVILPITFSYIVYKIYVCIWCYHLPIITLCVCTNIRMGWDYTDFKMCQNCTTFSQSRLVQSIALFREWLKRHVGFWLKLIIIISVDRIQSVRTPLFICPANKLVCHCKWTMKRNTEILFTLNFKF